jgi:hypothetical protein
MTQQEEQVMTAKLSPAQQTRIAWLNTLPPKFARIRKVIELMSTNHADDNTVRSLIKLLGELKAQAGGLNILSLAEPFGYMETLLRRGGGHQLKVRGLGELLGSATTNYEGAVREATTPENRNEAETGEQVTP